MLGRMLVGAWLLIQQQCCSVYGDSAGFRGAALVDPLMRRSPLEKNFMRFGRSGSSAFDTNDWLKDNFTPIVRTSRLPFHGLARHEASEKLSKSQRGTDGFAEKSINYLQRIARAKDSFMRFGRGGNEAEDTEKYKIRSNSIGLGRDGYLDDVSDMNVNLQTRTDDDEIIPGMERMARSAENFIRFGRDGERIERSERNKQGSFIRFGKSRNAEENVYDDCYRGRVDETTTRTGRSKENFMRFGKRNDQHISDGKNEAGLIRVARDQDGVLRSVRQRQQDNSNAFIRFGRGGRKKRRVLGHKDVVDPDLEACQYYSDSGTAVVSGSACGDEHSSRPHSYRPSLYRVLAGLLPPPESLMLLSRPSTEKAKPSKSDLHDFSSLGL